MESSGAFQGERAAAGRDSWLQQLSDADADAGMCNHLHTYTFVNNVQGHWLLAVCFTCSTGMLCSTPVGPPPPNSTQPATIRAQVPPV
jgi:hypothetical protein